MLPILQLGGAAIPLPPLILLVTVYIALDIAQRQAIKRGLDGDKVYNLGFNALIIALLASRLAFIVLNFSSYRAIQPPGRMLITFVTPLLGSELLVAGLIVGLAYAAYFVRRHQFNWARTADAFAIGGAIFVIGLWLAQLASGDSYGVATRLPWGIDLWGAKRHPTQVYNLIAALAVLMVLWRVDSAPLKLSKSKVKQKKKRKSASRKQGGGGWRIRAPYDGFVAQLFVLLTSLTILLLEPLRADSRVMAEGIRVWQVGALVALVASLAIAVWRAPASESRPSSA